MHGFPESITTVEEDGHVGHGAVLHGCVVGQDALISMNYVIMDDVVIGAHSIVSASAFVRAGVVVPERVLMAGVR